MDSPAAETTYPAVILGLWPIAGITSVGVDRQSSRRTIAKAIELGLTWFDTAFSYGFDGESDRLIGELVASSSTRLHVIGKVGQRWTPDRQRVVDARPETLIQDAETSLQRMRLDAFDLLMLHSVDPQVPIEESAGALARLKKRGLAARIGVCNVELDQLKQFAEVAPVAAVQTPLNLWQREGLEALIPWCAQQKIAVHVYWVLMKGILAGKIGRDHQFDQQDSRPKYEVYRGEARQRTHRLLERMEHLASQLGTTVAQLSIGWALACPGVTSALVGAKRDWQIEETASSRALPADVVAQLDDWIREISL